MAHLRTIPPRPLALLLALATTVSLFALPANAQEPPVPAPVEEEELVFEDAERISTANIRIDESGSANARWLSDLYENVFLREADVSGLDHWLAFIPAGGDARRTELANAFLTSREGAAGEVVRSYADVLDRGTDPSGLEFWTNYLRENPVIDLRFSLYVSDEFYDNAGGTAETFSTALYQRILLREPDAQGLAYWTEQLEQGASRAEVTASFHFSDESMENRVVALYLDVLEREPVEAELTAGVAQLRSSDERDLRGQLLGSDEAFERFASAALGG